MTLIGSLAMLRLRLMRHQWSTPSGSELHWIRAILFAATSLVVPQSHLHFQKAEPHELELGDSDSTVHLPNFAQLNRLLVRLIVVASPTTRSAVDEWAVVR